MAGPSPDRRPAPRLPPRLIRLLRWRDLPGGDRLIPGMGQRRRLLVAWLAALFTLLLRPWPPFLWLPGWCVGGLLLWAIAELVGWLWWPQRSA